MPSPRRYDVIGLGHAIADILAETPDGYPERHGLAKGAMTLLHSEEQALRMAASLSAEGRGLTTVSGGSAANTVSGIALLGLRGAFIGKTAPDEAGRAFKEDLRAQGVFFGTPDADEGIATGRCCIAVAPNGERTMATYLGAARRLSEPDIDSAPIAESAVLYTEAYLWDDDYLQRCLRAAMDKARAAGTRVSFSLSDPFCVARHRDSLYSLIDDGTVDILFGNAEEMQGLYPDMTDAALAVYMAQRSCLCFVTKGKDGASVLRDGAVTHLPAAANALVVDTTGAGDLFAAGALYGLLTGQAPERAAAAGIAAATHVISHIGGRATAEIRDRVWPALAA
jgi:sugar/nucleoside kinase (ribokinase family)